MFLPISMNDDLFASRHETHYKMTFFMETNISKNISLTVMEKYDIYKYLCIYIFFKGRESRYFYWVEED